MSNSTHFHSIVTGGLLSLCGGAILFYYECVFIYYKCSPLFETFYNFLEFLFTITILTIGLGPLLFILIVVIITFAGGIISFLVGYIIGSLFDYFIPGTKKDTPLENTSYTLV